MRRRDLSPALLIGPAAILVSALLLGSGPALASEAKKESGPVDTYVPVPPVNTSVANPYGGRTVMTVETGLDIPDAALRDRAGLLMTRLRGAFLEVVQIYGTALAPGAAPNADLLAQRLQQSADQVLGKPGARLLLGSLMIN